MYKSLIRFDFLIITIFFLLMFDRIFLTNTVITPVFILAFLILVPFVYIFENRIKINVFLIFFIYILFRTFLNKLSVDTNLFKVGFSTSIQIISIALIIPAVYYIVQDYKERISPIIYTIKIFIFINTLLLMLSSFNIYLLDVNLYESYGSRHFGILGDQLPWIMTFMIAYSIHHKNYFLLVFYLIGIILSGSLNASAVAFVILAYYIFKDMSVKNIFYIIFFSIIIFFILDYLNLNFLERLYSGKYTQSLDHRTLAVKYGIENINNYFMGNGYGTYSYLNGQNIIRNSALSHTIFGNSFNQYLQIMIDLGIIGLCLFFMLIYKIFMLKSIEFLYIKIWILSLLIFNQSGVWLLPSSYIWIIVSIGLGILIYENEEIKMNFQDEIRSIN